MTDKERLESVKAAAESMYMEILIRPQMMCRVASIESFVLAIERILDIIDPNRDNGYLAFLSQCNLGMHLFESKYEFDANCLHTFVKRENVTGENGDCLDAYIDRFKLHWGRFLDWRQQQNDRARAVQKFGAG